MSQAIFGKKLRIIVADADDANRAARAEFIRTDLEHEVVAECATLEDLAQQCNDLTPMPSLVIADSAMSNLTELAKLVKNLKENRRSIPFLILNEEQAEQIIRDAVVPGYTLLLQKPVTDQHLGPNIITARASFKKFRELTQSLANAEEKLETAKTIERAKGILRDRPEHSEKTDAEIYNYLAQQLAGSRNIKAEKMAQRIIEAESSFYPIRAKPNKP